MSFILDALRKSEHERDRRAGPATLEPATTRPTNTGRPWLLAAGALLLLANLIVLVWVLERSPSKDRAAPPVVSRNVRDGTVVRPSRMDPPQPETASTIRPVVRPLSQEVSEPPEAASVVAPSPAPPRAPAPRTTIAPAARPPASAPSIRQLSGPLATGLPALEMALHVYSADPAKRFVVINGERATEGTTLKSGPSIERITPEGVVLVFQGQRFSLP
jgi:general secretion pathway protein B